MNSIVPVPACVRRPVCRPGHLARRPVRLVLSPTVALALGMVLSALPSTEARADRETGPLAPLARLVGGEWHTEGQFQVMEWGLDGRSIHASGYRWVAGEPVLVSDGMIFHHPADDSIRGTFAAEGMGIDLFEYRFEARGDTLHGHLRTHGAMAGSFEEIWVFTDDDHYDWKLYQRADDELRLMMEASFERRASDHED